ncbi:MAG TPA: hypothetical protein VFO74_01310, partial [Pseudolabrys sp.]|nr:hypothetical protein [Pseudolabrys sp.]
DHFKGGTPKAPEPGLTGFTSNRHGHATSPTPEPAAALGAVHKGVEHHCRWRCSISAAVTSSSAATAAATIETTHPIACGSFVY